MPWTYREPLKIPPREWLVGTILLRGHASLLGSTGGVGKTTLAVALVLSYVTGRRDILGLHVFQTGKAWLITLEDDREELERRIAAAMIAHGIRHREVEGKLFVNGERPLLLARCDETGAFTACEDAGALADGIIANDIGLTVIDPLIKSHRLIENSNEHMDQLLTLANDAARNTHSSILITSHFRKGGGENGGRDAIRGGSALVDGARIARTLIPMTTTEAQGFNIPTRDASRYVRINDAKQNLAPKGNALWIELLSIPLGNCEVHPAYPSGDHVQAAKVWQPPTAFEGLDASALEQIFDQLREGAASGWFYSAARQAKFWAGDVIVRVGGKSKKDAATVLKKWLETGVLKEIRYDTPSRNEASKVTLNEDIVREILAHARGFAGADD